MGLFKKQQTTKDPVCGMEIAAAQAAGSMEHAGRTVYFCSAACQTKFEADPNRYA
jgi:YHS domain-containing protein